MTFSDVCLRSKKQYTTGVDCSLQQTAVSELQQKILGKKLTMSYSLLEKNEQGSRRSPTGKCNNYDFYIFELCIILEF